MVPTETQDPPMTQEERESAADFDPASNPHLRPVGEAEQERPRTLEEIEAAQAAADAESQARAREAGLGEEDDGQMFVFEQGRKVTLGTLVGRNVPVTYEVKLTGKVLKGPGSLLAFNEPDMTLIVPVRAGRVEVDPVYADDGTVKEVHVRQNIKARTFYDAQTEAGQVALRGE